VGKSVKRAGANYAWLLGLAVAHGLRFVSFDNALPMQVVRGAASDHWLVI